MIQASIWEKETFYSPRDIIIAGSGFAGLWSAYYLKKKNPELSITIVDRGIIPTGASTRNAGFACFGSLTELIRDAHEMGEEKMLQLVKMRAKGLDRIRQIFNKKTIDFDLTGGYELITPANNISDKTLTEHIKWLNSKLLSTLKMEEVFALADKKISKFGLNDIRHLIENKLEGSLHPGKLCQALLATVQSAGVTVLNSMEITGYEKSGDTLVLTTREGINLRTKKLLVCTNAFARQLLPELDIVPARGQILLTSPIPDLKIKGCFHFNDGYFYFRNLDNRLLLGGARNIAIKEETTGEMTTSPLIQHELESFLSQHLLAGKRYEITDRWSGIMGFGSEKTPLVRKINDHVFCAVRMSGMGVALTPMIGEKIAKMILDKS